MDERCTLQGCRKPDLPNHHHHPSMTALSAHPCVRRDCDFDVSFLGTDPITKDRKIDDGCGCMG